MFISTHVKKTTYAIGILANAILLFCGVAFALDPTGGYDEGKFKASNIKVDTVNFDNNLTSDDNDVQKALETLDEMVGGGGGSGDITSIGDVASGAAFDGTQGTTLTFNNAGGDATLAYDGTNMTFNAANDLEIDLEHGTDSFWNVEPVILTPSTTWLGVEAEGFILHNSTDTTDGTWIGIFSDGSHTPSYLDIGSDSLMMEWFVNSSAGTTPMAAKMQISDYINPSVIIYSVFYTNGYSTDAYASVYNHDLMTNEQLGVRANNAPVTPYWTYIQGGAQVASNITYTVPTAYPGGNGYGLTSTTAGVWSWSDMVSQTEGDAAYQPKDADLTSIAGNSTNGFISHTASDTYTARTIGEGTAIDVTNGDGVSGAPSIAFDSTELESVTFGAGAAATIVHTYDVSGTDTTMTMGSALTTFSGAVTSTGKITGNSSVDIKNGATSSGVLAIFEDSDDGSNKATFQVPALAGDTAYILPADDGDNGQVLSTNGTGTLDWIDAGAGSGDVTAVGDCATGDCFTGTSGSTLTFNDTVDATIDYDNVGFVFDRGTGNNFKIGLDNADSSLNFSSTDNGIFKWLGKGSGDTVLTNVSSVGNAELDTYTSAAGMGGIINMTSTDTDGYVYLLMQADTSIFYYGTDGSGANDHVLYFNDGGDNRMMAITDAGTTGNLAVSGDLTITGDDLFMTTNTSGAILVADGTNFNPVVMSGDVSVGTTGTATIAANSVALTTDTTGNYAAGDAEAGAALTGDSATSFFSTGTVEGARLGTFSKSFTITSVTSAGDFGAIWKTPAAITITRVNVVQVGATNVVGHLDECDADGASCAGVDGATDITADGNNDADDGSLSNASIDANDWIGWHTTSVSGTNTRVSVTFDYTVN